MKKLQLEKFIWILEYAFIIIAFAAVGSLVAQIKGSSMLPHIARIIIGLFTGFCIQFFMNARRDWKLRDSNYSTLEQFAKQEDRRLFIQTTIYAWVAIFVLIVAIFFI